MTTLACTLFVLLLLIHGCFGFVSTSGREFVVTFQENEVVRRYDPEPECITLTSVQNDDTAVQVTSLDPETSFNAAVTINNNTSEHMCLDSTIQLQGTGVKTKVVKISAEQTISVMVHDVERLSADSYVAIPVENYGTDYYIMSYWDESQFSVTAIENNTAVAIKFPIKEANSENYEVEYGGMTLFNPSDIVLILQEYEVFQLHMSHDLTGVFVSSDKPVAVVSGNRKIRTSDYQYYDHLAEQMPPVDTWGTHFTSVPSPGKTNTDIYTILASAPCTSVNVGNTTYLLEKEGNNIRMNLSSTVPIQIVSDKPILVTKVIAAPQMGLEACMMMIVPQRQWLSDYTFRFPDESTRGGYLIVVVESRLISSLLLGTEQLIITNWQEVENTMLFVGYKLLDKALYSLHLHGVDGSFAAYIQHSDRLYAYCCHLGMNLEKINAGWTHTESYTPCSTTTDSTADSSTEETTTDSTADGTIETTTDSTADGADEITTDSTADGAAEITTDSTADGATEITTDSTADVSTEITTDSTGQGATETTTDSTADGSTEITTLYYTDTTVDSSSQPKTSDYASDYVIDETNETLITDSSSMILDNETCFTVNPQLLNLSVTDEVFLNIIEELKEHLKVVPQKTSQALRKKISVPDYRTSSTTIGMSWWIVVVVGFILAILAGDLLRMVKDFRYGFRK